jgi:hypothetical protein
MRGLAATSKAPNWALGSQRESRQIRSRPQIKSTLHDPANLTKETQHVNKNIPNMC